MSKYNRRNLVAALDVRHIAENFHKAGFKPIESLLANPPEKTWEAIDHLFLESDIMYASRNILDERSAGQSNFVDVNHTFRQPICYAMLFGGDSIVIYQRCKGNGESRLLGMYSSGYGGHFEVDNLVFKESKGTTLLDFGQTAYSNLVSEIREEAGIDLYSLPKEAVSFNGVCYYPRDEVKPNDVNGDHIALVMSVDIGDKIKTVKPGDNVDNVSTLALSSVMFHTHLDAIKLERWTRDSILYAVADRLVNHPQASREPFNPNWYLIDPGKLIGCYIVVDGDAVEIENADYFHHSDSSTHLSYPEGMFNQPIRDGYVGLYTEKGLMYYDVNTGFIHYPTRNHSRPNMAYMDREKLTHAFRYDQNHSLETIVVTLWKELKHD